MFSVTLKRRVMETLSKVVCQGSETLSMETLSNCQGSETPSNRNIE